ncbi:hypothetical protein CAL61_05600 [Enterobacter hormaechei]|uniref:hypothetical protein n=1 Tax=Enterobacter hormaechei TaxID=158836 RepID=UPI000D72FFE7|nr:hypothetical protein [Enterobacter hormaechei]AWQ42479.1 hypothetical protein BET69_05600 [Enterobacter hormaechei]AWQ56692.1 hypothetical protein CAL61_05600 [Enterobacter hormaechei]
MSNIDKQALVIPQRERHDWSQAVMRNCDFCQQWALTVRHSDGGCICASCCDSEYTTALTIALVVALDELEAKDRRIADYQARLYRIERRCDHHGSVYWDVSNVKRCAKCGMAIIESANGATS